MKLLARLFPRREMNLTTALERQRLANTMPGQTGAMARRASASLPDIKKLCGLVDPQPASSAAHPCRDLGID